MNVLAQVMMKGVAKQINPCDVQSPENQRTPERIFRCRGLLDSASVSVSNIGWVCGTWCPHKRGGHMTSCANYPT